VLWDGREQKAWIPAFAGMIRKETEVKKSVFIRGSLFLLLLITKKLKPTGLSSWLIG